MTSGTNFQLVCAVAARLRPTFPAWATFRTTYPYRPQQIPSGSQGRSSARICRILLGYTMAVRYFNIYLLIAEMSGGLCCTFSAKVS